MKPLQKKKSTAARKPTELDESRDLVVKAKQRLDVGDAYVKWLLSQKGSVSADLDLEF